MKFHKVTLLLITLLMGLNTHAFASDLRTLNVSGVVICVINCDEVTRIDSEIILNKTLKGTETTKIHFKNGETQPINLSVTEVAQQLGLISH